MATKSKVTPKATPIIITPPPPPKKSTEKATKAAIKKVDKKAKKARFKVHVGGVYMDGNGKKVEIVGRVRGNGDFDFLAIVRNLAGPRWDRVLRYDKYGREAGAVERFALVREIT